MLKSKLDRFQGFSICIIISSMLMMIFCTASFLPIKMGLVPRFVVGPLPLLALMALVAIALGIGHALGGPAHDDGTALAVACASRHIGIAVLVAASLPGPRTAAIVAVYIVASAVVTLP